MNFKLIDLDEKNTKRLIKAYLLTSLYSFIFVVVLLGLFSSLVIIYNPECGQVERRLNLVSYVLFPHLFLITLMSGVLLARYKQLCSFYLKTSIEVSKDKVIVRSGRSLKVFRVDDIKGIQSFHMFKFKNERGTTEKYHAIFLNLKRTFGIFSRDFLIRIESNASADEFVDQLQVYFPVKIKRNMW